MKININGAVTLIFILAMIVFLVLFKLNSYIIYSGLAIILYVTTIFFRTGGRYFRRFTRRQRAIDRYIDSPNIVIGIHLSFVLLTLGMLLRLGFGLQILYFLVAVIIGLMLPFILIRQE